MNNPHPLQDLLHRHIPAAAALSVKVVQAAPNKVVLSAPLVVNRNHHGTMFGGSLSLLATLCGWSMMHLLFPESSGKIVIADSRMHYILPTEADALAVCECDAELLAAAEQTRARLHQKGKASLTLNCRIECQGRTTADFSARYAAFLSDAE